MPATISFTLQHVNGDPFVNGKNINITGGETYDAVFNESGTASLSNVAAGDTVTIGGVTYQYDYLGSHNVRGDADQPAAYIRIINPIPSGGTLSEGNTFAIDLTGEPGDANYPNLPNGNTKGSVADLDTSSDVQLPGVVCFAKGTMVLTTQGEKAVEDLAVGDLIETADAGPQPVIWLSSTKLTFDDDNEDQKPILISAQALGLDAPQRDLIVSPQHKVVLVGDNGEEVLAPAKGLTSQRGIRRMNGRKKVTYFHVLLPAHSIICAQGVATESFYPGPTALKMLSPQQRREVETALPYLKSNPSAYGPEARKPLTRGQAEKLGKGVKGLTWAQNELALLAS